MKFGQAPRHFSTVEYKGPTQSLETYLQTCTEREKVEVLFELVWVSSCTSFSTVHMRECKKPRCYKYASELFWIQSPWVPCVEGNGSFSFSIFGNKPEIIDDMFDELHERMYGSMLAIF